MMDVEEGLGGACPEHSEGSSLPNGRLAQT